MPGKKKVQVAGLFGACASAGTDPAVDCDESTCLTGCLPFPGLWRFWLL
ncbi:hypothetical protein LHGZ1_1792 [Laribacter hongkongensis]|uniref:Uncharacterized protein n=1 Tax=Laribacter hongkongensis TaxID=168471 RepID=A0A248LKC6_9NEIS|nr:hypothetical protein LHGZ1_1792 [Laribacter hongkongensis]